jgi:ABC-type multidrug transport system fused ATPase/permease subunit
VAVCWASRVSMGVGADARATVYGRVQGFSAGEMNHFGTQSLITRNANDVQQIQLFLQMALTLMVIAPIMCVGGVIMAVKEGSALSPPPAVAVAVPVMAVVREHWLIAECVMAGERRPHVAALITLDEAAFARWKQRQGKPAGATIGELRDDADLRAVVQQAVDRAKAGVSRPETIKRFRILAGPFQVGAELTPTGKVRRDYVLAKHASDIDALYA